MSAENHHFDFFNERENLYFTHLANMESAYTAAGIPAQLNWAEFQRQIDVKAGKKPLSKCKRAYRYAYTIRERKTY